NGNAPTGATTNSTIGATTAGAGLAQATTTTSTANRTARSRRQQEHLGDMQDMELGQPEREAFRTLNDLLQRTRISNGKIHTLEPHHQQLQQQQAQTPTTTTVISIQQQQREALRQLADHTSYDPTDHLQEQQQRYCFPVRPVQRVQHQQQQQ
ncbi:uncharacterized protein Dwil_GK27719, partial [Drosophila willistoni]